MEARVSQAAGGRAGAKTRTDDTARRTGVSVSPGEGRVFGYARVSSADQNLARQLDALAAFGVEPKMVFTDTLSGRDFGRPGYQRLVRRLRPGDTLVVKSIDRFGRSYDDIICEWRRLTKERHVGVVVLDMPLLDTRAGHAGLTGEVIGDIVLQLLSYAAQLERENIRQRQAEGIEAAHARGVRFGRPPIERPEQYGRALELYEAGEIGRVEAARICGVSLSTFRRWLLREGVRPSAGA